MLRLRKTGIGPNFIRIQRRISRVRSSQYATGNTDERLNFEREGTMGSQTAQAGSSGDAKLEQLAINTIRTLSMDAVQAANSGHPGAPMGMAPTAYVLWQKLLRYDPQDPIWPNRDRFVLSAGH